MKWEPIETAPNGELIVYYPRYEKGRTKLSPLIRVGYKGTWGARNPTHWMPLPDPPK